MMCFDFEKCCLWLVGDIIRLDTKVDSELEVFVGSIRKFKAVPGTEDKKYAARITEVIREEE